MNLGESEGGRLYWVKCCCYHQFCPASSFVTWTVAHQAPLSMGFSRQEYWNGLPFPSQGYLPNPGMEPVSPALAGGFFTTEPPQKLHWVE